VALLYSAASYENIGVMLYGVAGLDSLLWLYCIVFCTNQFPVSIVRGKLVGMRSKLEKPLPFIFMSSLLRRIMEVR
jgi:hypothetical protein